MWALFLLVAFLAGCCPLEAGVPVVELDLTASERYGMIIEGSRQLVLDENICEMCEDTFVVSNAPSLKVRFAGGSWDPNVILLNKKGMLKVMRKHGEEAIWGTLFHEWGHLISKEPGQLIADAWAGCLLRRKGLDFEPFVAALKTMGASFGSMPIRSYAVRKGWMDCISKLEEPTWAMHDKMKIN